MSEEVKKSKKKQTATDAPSQGESFVEAAPSESSESAAVEEALDVLFEEQTVPLPELIEGVVADIEKRVEKLNKETTKDGSKAGVHTHGTRLMSHFRVFRDACKLFVDFLKKEGHE